MYKWKVNYTLDGGMTVKSVEVEAETLTSAAITATFLLPYDPYRIFITEIVKII